MARDKMLLNIDIKLFYLIKIYTVLNSLTNTKPLPILNTINVEF